MRRGHQTPQTAGTNGRLIYPSIDAALIDIARKNSEELADPAEPAHQPIPEITIHPIGQARAHPTKRDDGASIQFVDPHFTFEKPKQLGLREFEGISVRRTLAILCAGFPIHPDAQSNAHAYKRQRKKQRRLD